MEPIQTLTADPPWKYGDSLPGKGRGAEKHYPVMPLWEIKRFPLPELAADSRLFLWTTAPFLRPAYEVMAAWGFRDTLQQMVWHKLGRLGMGHRVRVQHEYMLIGERGRPPVLSHSVRSVFESRPGRHSAKPDIAYALIEQLSPGPYAELFARERREGWTCYGNELAPLSDDPGDSADD